jgi:autotransporter-associated beta strand protein
MNLLTKAPGIASPLHVPFTPASPGSNPRFVRKIFLQTILAVAISVLAPIVAHAGSATWDLDPGSGDWNTAANWTPMTVPNGPADTATFALSNNTNVSIFANTEVNGITFTSVATNPYGITVSPGFRLTLSGTGITNNSGTTQNFGTAADASGNVGTIVFSNNATAGSNVSIFNEGGSTNFFNNATAGSAFIENDYAAGTFGSANFFNSSTAGNSGIFNFGDTTFFDSSTAGNSTTYTDGAFVTFFNSSTAGSAFIGVSDNSFLQFANTSTAGSAFIGATGFVAFYDDSSAARATINSAGIIEFNGSSTGGIAQVQLQSLPDYGFFAFLDISGHNAPGLTIGSLEGDEFATVFLGANNLTVGSNDLSTTFSGVIQDGGFIGGTGGSLTKIGSGTLILSGANTYTGITNVKGGVLQVDGSISSNTFVNHGGALAGGGTINGNVTNNHVGKVSPGDVLSVPGVLTVEDNYTQTPSAALLIQIAGADAGQVSVLDVRGNANLNGFLNPVLLNGFVPAIGQSFTFLNYASFTGFFSHIQNAVFDNRRKRWLLVYLPTGAYLIAVKNGP